jgi:eukaryotic-like serine/threonine-protein kinase
MTTSHGANQIKDESIAWTIVRRLGMVVVLGLVFVMSATVTVYLLIRTGDTRVPDVRGKTEAEAIKLSERAGLRVNIQKRNNATVPADVVIETRPGPESSVKKDSAVTILVSAGPTAAQAQASASGGDLLVPELSGKTLAEARAAAEQVGLRIEVRRRSNASVPVNTVVESNPPVNAPVKRDSTVVLIVSSGPRPKSDNTNGSRPANTNRAATTNRSTI